jgi:hypothetical protein
MKTELKEFIDSQEQDLRPTLYQYYDVYLKLRANGNEDKASNDVLAFCQRNQGELDHKVDHEIDKMENDNFIVARGLKRKRKSSKRSKKSKKSKSRKSKKSKKSKKSRRTKSSKR